MAKKVKIVKGFYMNKKTGHPSYAFSQRRKRIESVGFTHNKNDVAKKVKLKHNIDKSDRADCYVKTVIEVQQSNEYRRTSKTDKLRIHKEDEPIILKIIKNNKKKR